MATMIKINLVSARSAIAAANALRAVMHGKVALPGDRSYAGSRRTWNGAVDHRPALFALCEKAQEVQASVPCSLRA